MKPGPVLFYKKEQCCGCGACVNKCHRGAISMYEDEYGFRYPKLEIRLCSFCGRCLESCSYQFEKLSNCPVQTYAAAAKDAAAKSAAGAVFAGFAGKVLSEGGYVCGSALTEDGKVQHIMMNSAEGLSKLHGTRHVQSDTARTYTETKELLDGGKTVLYAGTSCQIEGLYGYLGKDKKYNNLITVDVICHGVSGYAMLLNYKAWLQAEDVKAVQKDPHYDRYFTGDWLHRETCLDCKYAKGKRPADITVGDYTGLEEIYPEYFRAGHWDKDQKIALVTANSERGIRFLEETGIPADWKEADYEKVACNLTQSPCDKEERERLRKIFAESGWSGIEKELG